MHQAILHDAKSTDLSPLRLAIAKAHLKNETEHLTELLGQIQTTDEQQAHIQKIAKDLVVRVRQLAEKRDAVESFMAKYDLSSEEGVLLMCVAEALLRVPDKDTADKLIRDKLGDADWAAHLGSSESMLVNASTWGLVMTGKLVNMTQAASGGIGGALKRLIGKSGEPMIRTAVKQAMRIMGHQFVMGETIEGALKRAQKGENAAFRYSYDMLGEAALTAADAERYFKAYQDAIAAIGASGSFSDVFSAPSISVKLSALHPRYEYTHHERVMNELVPKVLQLAQQAKSLGIGFTVDAEEADRLDISLDVIAAAYADESLAGWEGFGLAVQAYQKRAPYVIDFMVDLARTHGRRIPMRLVKGAYWDAEVKLAQVEGLSDFPVFTRKPSTDVSYLACVQRMFAADDALYPMFATHNAHTIASVMAYADGRDFEFQRLHGMGEDLYAQVISKDHFNKPCRVYAPVGTHKDLLPYLVRRLLENGANTSFVNKITDEATDIEELIRDPIAELKSYEAKPHPQIKPPSEIFPGRANSRGINLCNPLVINQLAEGIAKEDSPINVRPLMGDLVSSEEKKTSTNPANRTHVIGEWTPATAEMCQKAIDVAHAAQPRWDAVPAQERAAILERAADLFEANTDKLIALCMREAGKTMLPAIAELREAVDFLRYYAKLGREQFTAPTPLPGPTGETNAISLHGRGVFVCISPWNFPLAIFAGQVAAALMAGNSVVAKAAEQTTLVGFEAVRLLHEAGIPKDVLHFAPGRGSVIGNALTEHPKTVGVAFTGSTHTARLIGRTMSNREDSTIPVIIAETGGQNAMIADSSTLPEQLVQDVIAGAFDSAGQRCSATRVLYIQDDVADRVITMLKGAMAELTIGDPASLSTDVGPVIDEGARKGLQAHIDKLTAEGKLIFQQPLPDACKDGTFVAPTAFEIGNINELENEQFGPILHVVRYKAKDLDKVLDDINSTGFGLTLGIHSRVDDTVEHIISKMRVGNVYVNRNQIGAVVGCQPFGGCGLSGTGPKAGGPHYLARFATERVVTINTTAAGGNASLLTLE